MLTMVSKGDYVAYHPQSDIINVDEELSFMNQFLFENSPSECNTVKFTGESRNVMYVLRHLRITTISHYWVIESKLYFINTKSTLIMYTGLSDKDVK